jgi:hypothetical protein
MCIEPVNEQKKMDDRRRESRRYLSYFSRVIDRDTGYLLGYLVDMTTGGALLVGNIYLQPSSTLRLRLDLPDGFSPQEQLDLDVRAVWSRPDKDPEFYRTGLQLMNIKPSDLVVLERLLSLHGTPI